MPINPNPQGKGLVPIMQGLDRHRLDHLLPPKEIDQVQMELFTSMFVLQSEFRFNPVPDRTYYLYQTDGAFKLLMVGPHEWGSIGYRGRYIGSCKLHQDRTWTLALAPAMAHDRVFMNHIEAEQEKLQQALKNAQSLDDVLPVFEDAFCYHARILAFILGRSLGISMTQAGINTLTYNEARGLLSHDGHDEKHAHSAG